MLQKVIHTKNITQLTHKSNTYNNHTTYNTTIIKICYKKDTQITQTYYKINTHKSTPI